MAEPDTATPPRQMPDASPYLWIPRRTLEQARRDIARLRMQAFQPPGGDPKSSIKRGRRVA